MKDVNIMHSEETAFVMILITYQSATTTVEIVVAIMSKMDTAHNVNVLMKNKVNMLRQVIMSRPYSKRLYHKS